ncbi:hypothetical protein JMA_29640 [Jeotgalibacillus malaysiensis]|uniref:TIGR01777 family protein n=1 Tax=Jeotgalibacillus malaysiensis TaxID=1508404 RepID=A0A0B5AQA2_9BACL|nr:TIGR01777 family oxidoreductase [Jeotgalibacillus malaysiensis]AJD92281.1 hypothetical protein JMA_29640 [Jeotgalibacillus malaysiensis]
MGRKIVIAGGSGFIGEYLQNQFLEKGDHVLTISRRNGDVLWDEKDKIRQILEDSDLLINLAGKSVNCRYTTKNKREIMNSRIKTTRILSDAVKACENPPALWINASSATYYKHSEDEPMTEKDGQPGSGFSVDVVREWERAFFMDQMDQTRKVAMRISFVLGKTGGVLKPYLNLAKIGLGGKQGDGNQMISWIHIEDLYEMIEFTYLSPQIDGTVNCSSPEAVTNRVFMKKIRTRCRRRIGLPATKKMIELGAFFLRTEPELVLKSRWVVPDKLLKNNYEFKYTSLDEALKEILTH